MNKSMVPVIKSGTGKKVKIRTGKIKPKVVPVNKSGTGELKKMIPVNKNMVLVI